MRRRVMAEPAPCGAPKQWANEISEAVSVYQNLRKDDSDLSEWLNQLKQRTLYWCALVLGGAEPFPPQPKPRLEPRFVKV